MGFAVFLAVVVLLTLLSIPSQAVEKSGDYKIEFTEAEKEWLSAHPRIRVGMMEAWPPLNFVGEGKTPQGIGADYVKAINRRLGGAIELVPAPFEDNYQKVVNRQLDALMDITRRPDREAYFLFTNPYIVIPHVIVGRKSGDYFNSEKDLAGKTVALEKGFYNVTHFRRNFPAVAVREYGSTSEALDAVARGEADAYAGNRAVVVYLIEKELFNNLRLMGKLAEPRSTLQFGVQKNQPLLVSILNKALASVSLEEERVIRQKWIQDSRATLDLDESEREWIKKHPVIRVALDPSWAPVEFLDEHAIPQGISVDYMKMAGDLLGLKFEIAKGADWQELVLKVNNRELDMFSSVVRTKNREDYISFTDSYLSLPTGIFTRQDAPYVGSLGELTGKEISVVKDHGLEFLVESNYPELAVVHAKSVADALGQLSDGRVDAFADSILTASYYLGRKGYSNIRLAGETPFKYEQSFGVRSDWPELVTLLNKALRAIPEADRNAVYAKWVAAKGAPPTDYSLIWKIVAGSFLVVLVFALWNWRLGKEISTRKQAELALQANQARLEQLLEERTARSRELEEARKRAEDADKLKSAFLATMSHELRTPLNSIIGFTGILLQELGGPINEEQKNQLSMVKTSANHLLSLISDVLDISKIEAGQLTVSSEPFNLKDSILKVAGTVRPLIEKKGLSLSVDISGDTGLLRGDARRVEQILLNLLSNALKFTENGSIRVGCVRENDRYVVTVSDTGIGIGEDDLGKLFKPFHQLDTGLSRRYEGTGLGLSICKRLVELMGGSIWVETRKNSGSTFGFSLPAMENNA